VESRRPGSSPAHARTHAHTRTHARAHERGSAPEDIGARTLCTYVVLRRPRCCMRCVACSRRFLRGAAFGGCLRCGGAGLRVSAVVVGDAVGCAICTVRTHAAAVSAVAPTLARAISLASQLAAHDGAAARPSDRVQYTAVSATALELRNVRHFSREGDTVGATNRLRGVQSSCEGGQMQRMRWHADIRHGVLPHVRQTQKLW
jgi:hypothetical protein